MNLIEVKVIFEADNIKEVQTEMINMLYEF